MTAGGPEDPRWPAALEVLRRTGAIGLQVRFDDSEQPVVWVAVAEFNIGPEGRPIPGDQPGRKHHEAAGATHPIRALFRLVDEVIDGGVCVNCGRVSGFDEDVDPKAKGLMDEVVCWWLWDAESKRYVQACQREESTPQGGQQDD